MNEKSKKFDINILELASRIFEKLKLEFKTILPQLIAISIALLVGALVLLVSGFSPIEAYGSLLAGAFGDIYGLGGGGHVQAAGFAVPGNLENLPFEV